MPDVTLKHLHQSAMPIVTFITESFIGQCRFIICLGGVVVKVDRMIVYNDGLWRELLIDVQSVMEG